MWKGIRWTAFSVLLAISILFAVKGVQVWLMRHATEPVAIHFYFFEIAESVLPGNLVSYAVAFFVAAFITAVAGFAFIARRLFGF
ncbi:MULTISPECIES: hypothetical protein [Planococcus]|uniref:Uncharacterized protein n=1 Tax=Planococcus citreus TaxID=1373 RepID=A0A497YE61_9BACL|nr:MULTISPECIES: hypothetical protein [Planococcus]MDE0583528.1 hypothetical protein [Planococcus sp. A6]RLJ86575.1 hypothetical protein DFR62_2177 [Planococcus citreus]